MTLSLGMLHWLCALMRGTHIFLPKRPPDLSEALGCVSSFLDKIKWAYHHKDSPVEGPKTKLPTKVFECKRFCKVSAPEITALCNNIQKNIWGSLAQTLSSIRGYLSRGPT